MVRFDDAQPLALVNAGPAGAGSGSGDLATSARRKRFVNAAGIALWLLASLGILAAIGATSHLESDWTVNAQGRFELAASRNPALRPQVGEVVAGLVAGDTSVVLSGDLTPLRSPRWIIDDRDRVRLRSLQTKICEVLDTLEAELLFADGTAVPVRPTSKRGLDLPIAFWALALAASALLAAATKVWSEGRTPRRSLYAVMALAQAANTAFIAMETAFEFGMPALLATWDMPIRCAFDLVTVAALLNLACLYPRRLPNGVAIAWAGWSVVAAVSALLVATAAAEPGEWAPSHVWWIVQAAFLTLGAVTVGLLNWSYRIEPHPFSMVMRRFIAVICGVWSLLTVALALAERLPRVPHNLEEVAATVCHLSVALMFCVLPFLARASRWVREITAIAALATCVTSLDLIVISVTDLAPFTALMAALVVSMSFYSTLRTWLFDSVGGSRGYGAERLFDRLYRIARDAEVQTGRQSAMLTQLLGEIFEPLRIATGARTGTASQVLAAGAGLMVPIPDLDRSSSTDEPQGTAVVMRLAHRGQRLFTVEDARLADRIVEQLQRAVHFDRAVEHGRTEERLRLAQDLHDDIGARLLTLMYSASSPEMEDYLRHTLLDLKTLTRGLSATNHRLSHAAAEWKADLGHRLKASHMALDWHFHQDEDPLLTVVQWSALTRILRELVSNAIAHAQAESLRVDFRLVARSATLTVTDDGTGREPQRWSHGLGVGGIRKRVRQLGGGVEWHEAEPRGIACVVTIRELIEH